MIKQMSLIFIIITPNVLLSNAVDHEPIDFSEYWKHTYKKLTNVPKSLDYKLSVRRTEFKPNKNNFKRHNLATLSALDTIINGTVEQIHNISKEHLKTALWAIEQIDLTLVKKRAIWETVKGNESSKSLSLRTIKALGNIILAFPETDLYHLNISDWNIVEHLGTIKGLTRRQAGIIGYALLNYWGIIVLRNTKNINKIKGLLCGFSPQDLSTIGPIDFTEIDKEVFRNIHACTSRQMKVLLQTAMSTAAHGPPQVWSGYHTNHLGLLVTAMSNNSIKKIRPVAMGGIAKEIIEAMKINQLEGFSKEQIDSLNDLSLAVFRSRMGIDSGAYYPCYYPILLFIIFNISSSYMLAFYIM